MKWIVYIGIAILGILASQIFIYLLIKPFVTLTTTSGAVLSAILAAIFIYTPLKWLDSKGNNKPSKK